MILELAWSTLFTRLSLVNCELTTHNIATIHSFDDCCHIFFVNINKKETLLASCLTISRPEKVSYWSNFFENRTKLISLDTEWNITDKESFCTWSGSHREKKEKINCRDLKRFSRDSLRTEEHKRLSTRALYPVSLGLQIFSYSALIFASTRIHYWNLFLYNFFMSENKKPINHIWFIMDGNRRWAKKLKNIVTLGHERGGDNIERVLELCINESIPYVSMWALSKENILQREINEINEIYWLIQKKVPKLIEKLIKNSIRLEVIWDLWLVPIEIRTILIDAIDKTSQWNKMTFILAIWYSWQDEIIRWVKRCIAEWIDPKLLTEQEFLMYLDSGKYPPPDLIIRTGWSIRHSWFYLYQSAYSEYYFTETLWPDFGYQDLLKALDSYNSSKRNFWK